MRRGLRRCGLALLGVVVVAACKKNAAPEDAGVDAAVDAGTSAADAAADVGAPADAAAEAATPATSASASAKPAGSAAANAIVGLPKTCVDSNKHLGTLTFTQHGNNVTITSSTTKAKATCTKKDEHYLICDWMGLDGKPSVSQRKVTYGPKRPIGGNFDTKHIFMCPAQ